MVVTFLMVSTFSITMQSLAGDRTFFDKFFEVYFTTINIVNWKYYVRLPLKTCSLCLLSIKLAIVERDIVLPFLSVRPSVRPSVHLSLMMQWYRIYNYNALIVRLF